MDKNEKITHVTVHRNHYTLYLGLLIVAVGISLITVFSSFIAKTDNRVETRSKAYELPVSVGGGGLLSSIYERMNIQMVQEGKNLEGMLEDANTGNMDILGIRAEAKK